MPSKDPFILIKHKRRIFCSASLTSQLQSSITKSHQGWFHAFRYLCLNAFPSACPPYASTQRNHAFLQSCQMQPEVEPSPRSTPLTRERSPPDALWRARFQAVRYLNNKPLWYAQPHMDVCVYMCVCVCLSVRLSVWQTHEIATVTENQERENERSKYFFYTSSLFEMLLER